LKITAIIQGRVATLDESPEIAGFFFRPTVEPTVEDLKAKGLTAAQSADVARKSLAVLESASEMTPAAAEPPMRALVEELGLSAGQVFGILRTAVTGQKVSPLLFESMEIIGRAEVLKRMKYAVELLEQAG
jgi:glutamyl-tRNA synthetase